MNISRHLTRLQNDRVGSSSSESWKLLQVRLDHTDTAEHAGLLIGYTCRVEAGCVIRGEEMPSFPR